MTKNATQRTLWSEKCKAHDIHHGETQKASKRCVAKVFRLSNKKTKKAAVSPGSDDPVLCVKK